MTEDNSISTKTNIVMDTMSCCPICPPSYDRRRRRRRRAPHSGGPGPGSMMTATAAAILSLGGLGLGRATTTQQYHRWASAAEHPPRESQSQRRHLYDPLNATKIGDSPLLSRRYRWLRQSPAMTRFLDDVTDFGASASSSPRRRAADAVYYYDDGNSNMNDDGNNAAADDAAAGDDDALAYDSPSPTPAPTVVDDDDDYSQQLSYCVDKTCTVNERCTKFLFGFLEGTTDAKDNCEGIMNAYVAADCGTIKKKDSGSASKGDSKIYNVDDDFNDDYFGIFYDHQCCSSLRSHYYEYCDSTELLNGYNLLVVAAVMLLCECGKSVVKKNRVRWLPEAAVCMLVGMTVALGASAFGTNIENVGFDEEIFMYLLLPPIIFEAALTVNKREFRRRRGAIFIFAMFGTVFSSFLTGIATYYSAKYFGDESLSILDSLVFGSLISSIDPVAILSVLTSLKMSETDTIYILVFGESLLNDGIAITLFKSLISQYQSKGNVSVDDVLGSVADFLIIAFGSCVIGLACGVACLCYFHLNSSILHPVMEVASFFLWAVVPYWMAEAFEWSGIVSIVVMGFFMDIYLRPGWDPADLELEEERRQLYLAAANGRKMSGMPPHGSGEANSLEYYNWDDDDRAGGFRFRGTAVDIPRPVSVPPPPPPAQPHERVRSDSSRTGKAHNVAEREGGGGDADTVDGGTSMMTNPNIKAILMKREFVRMSREADEHVRFVAHILSSLSENAIFAYLGLFLFSSKYEWDGILCPIGVASCITSRALMVVLASWVIWYMHVFRQRAGCQNDRTNACNIEDIESKDNLSKGSDESNDDSDLDPLNMPISKSARALSNYKVQVVLILAGLRGAVSLALVESVPIYNGVTGVGSKNKPLLKAMTSSAIIFTIFVLGGGAYYILKWLDISSDDMLIKSTRNPNLRQMAYLNAPLVCSGLAGNTAEMELSSAPSWKVHSRSEPLTPRTSSFVPPTPRLLTRSRSESSQASNYSGSLNDIVDRQLLGGQMFAPPSQAAPVAPARVPSTVASEAGSSRSQNRQDPSFPPQVV